MWKDDRLIKENYLAFKERQQKCDSHDIKEKTTSAIKYSLQGLFSLLSMHTHRR